MMPNPTQADSWALGGAEPVASGQLRLGTASGFRQPAFQLIGERMNDLSQGSQSKTVVFIASLFIACLGLVAGYILFLDPDPESVFLPFRKWYVFYPVMVIAVVVFGRLAFIGFRKIRTLPKW